MLEPQAKLEALERIIRRRHNSKDHRPTIKKEHRENIMLENYESAAIEFYNDTNGCYNSIAGSRIVYLTHIDKFSAYLM